MEQEPELTLRKLLNGSRVEQAEALKRIDDLLRHPICSQVSKRFPGLSIEDIAECWSQTLEGVWRASQEGTVDLLSDQPIENFIWQICHKKAIDKLRRKNSFDDVVIEVGRRLQGTLVGDVWRSKDMLERKELLAIVRNLIASLPPRQKVVLQAFVDRYPITAKDLAREISREIGSEVTDKSVERALEEGRKKIQEAIRKTDYGSEARHNE